jgi:hypothetical protein
VLSAAEGGRVNGCVLTHPVKKSRIGEERERGARLKEANWPTDPVYFFTFESSIPVPSGDSSDIPQACALAPHMFRKHARSESGE